MDKCEETLETSIAALKESITPKTQDKIYRLGMQRGLESALEMYRHPGEDLNE